MKRNCPNVERWYGEGYVRICPNPGPLWDAYNRLVAFSKDNRCRPWKPPFPLILGGWAFSSDFDKMQRWNMTVAWARGNGCAEIVDAIPDEDFYVDIPSTWIYGEEMARWNWKPRVRPSSTEITSYMETLRSRWPEVVGPELARTTGPVEFTGTKARRLLVRADATALPPWGSWSHISNKEVERQTFTRFRAEINRAIAPHEVDHIDFSIEPDPLYRRTPQSTV